MNRALILMYHIVAEPLSRQEARYCCSPRRFEAQMRHLRASGVRLLTLDEIAAGLDDPSRWPGEGVAVTFDDGFADTFANALPILARHNIPATMFALADRIDASNDWMTPRGFPARRLMSAVELRAMRAAGVSIGSHTRTHPRLPGLDGDCLQGEIRGSKRRLEELLGERIAHFAYPYGLYDDAARHAVREAGYRSACSTRSGFNGPDADRFQLRRIEVFGADTLWQFRQKLRFGANDASLLYPLRYYASRLAERLGL